MRTFASYSNAELLSLLEQYAERERANLSEFLACLSLVDQKLAATEAGYASLYDYCVQRPRLSEGEAWKRIQVARLSQSRPEILSYIADGSITLSAAAMLVPAVKKAGPDILSRAQNKTTREIETMLAPLSVGGAPPARITPIMRRDEPVGPLFEVEAPPDAVLRYSFSFEGPRELQDAIERARQVLSVKYPFGQLDGILLEILTDWLDENDPLSRPNPKEPKKPRADGAISAWAHDLVWKRDGGRCAYVAVDGTRCESRRFLELDHIVPRALGGDNSPENLRLLCRAHNDLERRRVLGEGVAR